MIEPLFAQVDGEPHASDLLLDRAFSYGHGVFETLRVRDGAVPLWPYHRRRLAAGLATLGIAADLDTVESHWRAALGGPARLLKLIISAGRGDRGYATSTRAKARIVVLGYPESSHPAAHYAGVTVHRCRTRLGIQRRLAGIKHLNRLEQILARQEWSDPRVGEGITADAEGNLIEGTFSNLFLIANGSLITPGLDRCGVAGTMRACLLDHVREFGLPAHIARVTYDHLRQADEAFLCNSVFGVWPIVRVLDPEQQDLEFRPGTITQLIQRWSRDRFGYPAN